MSSAEDKSSEFTTLKLAEYVTSLYAQETGEFFENNELVRSVSSCRRDMMKWGFYLGSNSNRPYFEGHERADVVAVRNQLVDYFSDRKHLYYTLTEKEESGEDMIDYVMPMRQEDGSKRVALFSHDESTYRSGETSKKKWMFPGREPLFQKGRMKSIMQSWFVLQHPIGPYFQLSESEFILACVKYPDLNVDINSMYYKNEASAQIVLDGVNYFNNDTILEQFERLFQMIEFCEALKDHDIELLVDNATTHTAKAFNINDFRKGSGYDCPVERIDWFDENNNVRTLECFDEDEDGEPFSKGLFIIAKELNLIPESSKSAIYKLNDLKELLKRHPAFKEETKLEELARRFNNIKIIYLPKFHCEMSPIEGVWAFGKNKVRRSNRLSGLGHYKNLLNETKDIIKESTLVKKLWRRFWHTIGAYKEGASCLEVLQKYFGSRCKANVQEHRQILNTKII